MSPLDRGVDRERPRRRAGSRPCGLPASGLSCQFSENQLSLGPTSATVSQSPGWQTPPRPRPGKPSRSPRSSPRSPAPTCSSWSASPSARSTRSWFCRSCSKVSARGVRGRTLHTEQRGLQITNRLVWGQCKGAGGGLEAQQLVKWGL